ncbi:threonine synthase [Stigmatella sp. ncwal1]|uniref:Threonine synthase n=1 Tax=Stigmatella ashevillensis TaxID=2995309 RepID=A0ABT5D6Y1_9BACT|nr:threonine synthase [Stigmatella ashevillena]MDC0709414.1 threonine synthase [Stigmatella ashevillena]
MPFSHLTHLSCTKCGKTYDPAALLNVCQAPGCAGSLFAEYDLPRLSREDTASRDRTIWRWHELMPARRPEDILTLGEGGTPLLHARRLGERLSMPDVWIKEEAGNPTGSFKARGLGAAVTMAKALGARAIALPTAGNAGGAAAAYAAKAGLPCHVFMPKDTPKVFRLECEAYGARVTLVDGLIDDCGRIVAQRKEAEGWFDVSTLKEPYRVEGKKTMGYELAEQFGWTLPDVIVYPTGGGTGLIGMWKAFDEMERLGWIGPKRPRMISVQAEGCAPIPKAFAEGKEVSVRFENAHTYASGLRVPKAYADYLVLKILRASKGEAVTISDDEMRRGVNELAASEGLYAAPEGGAAWEAVKKLLAAQKVQRTERVVVFDTGTGYKYID